MYQLYQIKREKRENNAWRLNARALKPIEIITARIETPFNKRFVAEFVYYSEKNAEKSRFVIKHNENGYHLFKRVLDREHIVYVKMLCPSMVGAFLNEWNTRSETSLFMTSQSLHDLAHDMLTSKCNLCDELHKLYEQQKSKLPCATSYDSYDQCYDQCFKCSK